MSTSSPHPSASHPDGGGTRSPSAPGSHPETEEKRDPEHQPDDAEEKEEPQPDTNEDGQESAPPLPDEIPPPLPDEAHPGQTEDDGWEPVWDGNAQAYYFYNRLTGVSQWENPRVPDAASATAPGTGGFSGTQPAASSLSPPPRPKLPVLGGYNPAIHGDYDPNASYARQYEDQARPESGTSAQGDPATAYAATGMFNRFTGRWQDASITPETHNDENKSRRQMNAFFDVDSAANSHDGRSLRAERSAKKLSKQELKMFKEKRREKKEEKRRAWLRD
ncbi:hypothetical protein N7474_000194 [Penicillium riverlandense]|uniref:uncharacterized protein n=1 Tax=Penicillium riverlandense TaxID=1903569 RepID=UPI0025465D9B|nr:uncharacterized protein N7474_000194 [Penicillium riverlandense]KAJ5831883.1 hypothetical protein N7474_000194 [Penicillium riverlandense]